MATLLTYKAKRDFGKTAEPAGKVARKKGFRYVIQKHAATRLHYDLRLELDGVMMSWAVTRGPSLVPGDKRLAIHVEDHPIEYNKFEGTIPKGEYGGGTVMIWDRGTWSPDHEPRKGMQKGHLDFELQGEKLKGHWHLVRMRKRPGERQEPWLLIKATDEAARKQTAPDILEEMPDSAVTGRTMDEIASQNKRVWHSNRAADDQPEAKRANGRARIKAAAKSAKVAKSAKSTKRRGSKKKPIAVEGARKSKLPDFIPPALATLSGVAPSSDDWVHEIKFDGYRIQARVDHGTVSLKTRNGLDWTEKFPTIAEACATLAEHDMILDGEAASFDEHGVSNFSALQDDLKTGRHDRLVYYVFDLLHLDSYDLAGLPLLERKRLLAEVMSTLPKNGVARLSEHFVQSGPAMLKLAKDHHLEGIVSKRVDALYRSGRVGDWLKIKTESNQEFIVIGYEPSDKRARLIRSLLLSYYDNGALRYAGRIGTGWGQKEERDLQKRLEAVARKDSPLAKIPEEERRRKVKWIEPKLVVEVEFRGWTGGTLVRQGSLKGIREDRPARQVVREVEQMPVQTKQAALRQRSSSKTSAPKSTSRSAKAKGVQVAGVALSHPDRVYWEDAGVTKEMLAEYYTQVWDWMRPHVTGRVLALVRCPDGAEGQCFFQKHASAGIDAKHLKLVPDDGDKSIAIDRVQGLVSLAQAGVLEIHVRGSSIDRLEEADRLVFDLDPGPGVKWKDVIVAAREVRKRLADLKLESFAKTTGGKGLHVVLPIRPAPWDDAKDFCRRLAEQMAADDPKRFTATIRKTARTNRIFIDYLRNSREATAIAPYSTRARPGATVSVPLTWDELDSQKVSNAFNVQNLPKRLSRLRRDPWEKIGRIKQALPTTNAKAKRR